MKQITYDNKVNLNTNPYVPRMNKVTAEDLNEIKSVVNENSLRSIITAYPGQSLKPTSGVTFFPLQNIRSQSGDLNKLTLDSGKIKIGKGVNHIMVSAACTDSSNSQTGRALYIYKNDDIIVRTLLNANINIQPSLSITNVLESVSENDLISIRVEGNGISYSGSKSLTWLTVEVID